MTTSRLPLAFRRFNLPEGSELELRTRVHTILAALYPQARSLERRQEMRYPYAHLVHLTPVGADGVTPCGESIVVPGKNLSENGLCFHHPEPILHRRMIASLDAGEGRWLGVLIDLSWCRFNKTGWYESGGRFLQLVPSPVKKAG
jgi:hypothetical protein